MVCFCILFGILECFWTLFIVLRMGAVGCGGTKPEIKIKLKSKGGRCRLARAVQMPASLASTLTTLWPHSGVIIWWDISTCAQLGLAVAVSLPGLKPPRHTGLVLHTLNTYPHPTVWLHGLSLWLDYFPLMTAVNVSFSLSILRPLWSITWNVTSPSVSVPQSQGYLFYPRHRPSCKYPLLPEAKNLAWLCHSFFMVLSLASFVWGWFSWLHFQLRSCNSRLKPRHLVWRWSHVQSP